MEENNSNNNNNKDKNGNNNENRNNPDNRNNNKYRYNKYKKKFKKNKPAETSEKNDKVGNPEKKEEPKTYVPKKNFRKRPSSRRNGNIPKKNENIVYEICPICEKEIYHPLYAIKDKESEKNAHFECIQKRLLEKEGVNLENNEKLYYLGGGSFGVVLEKRYRGKLKIIIKNRFQY
jgi:hypothetical protein